MATIDQQFVEYIVKTLVNNPEKVTVDRKIDEKGVLLSLTVDPEDVGRVMARPLVHPDIPRFPPEKKREEQHQDRRQEHLHENTGPFGTKLLKNA